MSQYVVTKNGVPVLTTKVGKKRKRSYSTKQPATKIPRTLGAPLATRGFGDMGLVPNREKKFFDMTFQSTAVSTNGSFYLLFCPRLGSDYNNRIGRKVIVKSLYTKAFFFVERALTNVDGFSPAQMMRMILFIDYQPNGATPITTDLLTNAHPLAHLNANNRDRFKIIKDKTYSFDPVLFDGTSPYRSSFNRTCADLKNYKKLNLETIFNSTNGGTVS